ncbi:MAG: UDP-N-acetylglucosamine--N-acetylmuramyl-(pentapeptide) pyrophosphoryl-undecaprenol N-acetylglucosamine transferase [Phycisphaerae bacterium]|nr:UDP-N-acetylglucosamine--N-acetylmuramyl-(pentapeptide) pyrophosphoryl-undecaprenol N-acetylglucosamine transferase [Phycisphaerae bacterium]
MNLLLAGGGTGGHLMPGLAVADALMRRDGDAEVWVFGTPRPIDRRVVPAAGLELIAQPVRPFSTRPWHWPGFYRAWRASCRMARAFIADHRPDVVLGLGGYAAGPAVRTAARFGLPTAILNPDAVPGRANRYLARIVDRVFCQWGVTVDRLPHPSRCRVVGCPVRADLDRLDRAECRRRLKLDSDRPTLLVTGASLGAGTVNAALPLALARLADRLDRPWQVLHQAGEGRTAEVAPPTGPAAGKFDYRVVDFIDNLPEAIAAADLVVCRAGASTLAELTAIGRASILLPYPYHADDHQSHNGRVLVDGGAAVMVKDLRDASANAVQLIEPLTALLTDTAARDRMAAKARAMGHPMAADEVVDELLRL